MEQITQIQKIISIVVDFCVHYSFQIIGAMIILMVGMFIAGWMAKTVIRMCEKKGIDVTLSKFLGSFTRIIVITFVIIMALGKFGISIAPLIAALAAMAFGASFALQGPLSNYGAGLVIIITRPFVVGNTIAIKGVHGVVEEVTLSTTILSTADGEKITIPNKQIVGEVLTNSFENKIIESSVGISYEDNPEKAISVISDTISGFSQITNDPAPLIGIEEYGDSAVVIGMRYWVPTKEYFKILYDVNLSVYKNLKEAGISIPFPQRDVRIVSKS